MLAGWVPMLFYAPLISSQRGATSWMRVRGLGAIFNPFHLGIDAYFVLFAFAGLVAVVFLRKYRYGGSSGATSESHSEKERSVHLVILAFTFLAVPYGLLMVSWAGLPLLLDRYALPSLIAVALLFGLVSSELVGDLFEVSADSEIKAKSVAQISATIFGSVSLAAMLAYPLGKAISTAPSTVVRPSTFRNLATEKMVLAVSDPHSYFPLYFESGESHRIYLILRTSKERDRCVRFNQRLNPIAVDDFLASHERFQILSVDLEREWLEAELRHRGGFRITIEDRSENSKLLTVVAQKEIQPH